MSALGTLGELPTAYIDGLTAHNLVPLWPSLRKALPHGAPFRRTLPVVWHYADVRPRQLEAGELTPIEKAERRVLVLGNPGLGLENMQATPSIYIGLQLILPRETAPNHRHSPSAVRFVVEGEGGFTIVDGEKVPMERGDLILTPALLWHEHRHEGSGPVIWLDALDLPTVLAQEASYALEGPPQAVRNQPDHSQTHYRRGGWALALSRAERSARWLSAAALSLEGSARGTAVAGGSDRSQRGGAFGLCESGDRR